MTSTGNREPSTIPGMKGGIDPGPRPPATRRHGRQHRRAGRAAGRRARPARPGRPGRLELRRGRDAGGRARTARTSGASPPCSAPRPRASSTASPSRRTATAARGSSRPTPSRALTTARGRDRLRRRCPCGGGGVRAGRLISAGPSTRGIRRACAAAAPRRRFRCHRPSRGRRTSPGPFQPRRNRPHRRPRRFPLPPPA